MDISIDALNFLETYFLERFKTSKVVERVYSKIIRGRATYKEAHQFAEEIGKIIRDAVDATFLDERFLIEGEILQNIAEKVLIPTLEIDHELVTEVCNYVQKDLNVKAGITLTTVATSFDRTNAAGIAHNLTNGMGTVGDQLISYSLHEVDNYLEGNATYQKNAGTRPQITRAMGTEACSYCEKLVYSGDYKGPGMPEKIFVRHRGCDCLLIYEPRKKKYQTPWTKKEYDDYENAVYEQRRYLEERDGLTFEEIKRRKAERERKRKNNK